MKEKEIKEEIKLPEGVEIKIDAGVITLKGKKGECQKKITDPKIIIKAEGNKVIVSAKNATKREKTRLGSCVSHISNMAKGANEGHIYKLKICSGHFPMNVAISGKDFIVKNFLGEKNPRALKLKEGADVKLEGEVITIESCSKELAGQTAADIEKLTRITNKDRRIFQDGIYITEKDSKPIR